MYLLASPSTARLLTCLPPRFNACLPTFLCLHTCLPASLPPSRIPTQSANLPAWLSACLPAYQLLYQPDNKPTNGTARHLVTLLSFPPARQPVSKLVYLHVCLSDGWHANIINSHLISPPARQPDSQLGSHPTIHRSFHPVI